MHESIIYQNKFPLNSKNGGFIFLADTHFLRPGHGVHWGVKLQWGGTDKVDCAWCSCLNTTIYYRDLVYISIYTIEYQSEQTIYYISFYLTKPRRVWIITCVPLMTELLHDFISTSHFHSVFCDQLH